MSAETQTSQENDARPNDKELNFRALEAKFNQERTARLEAERLLQERNNHSADGR